MLCRTCIIKAAVEYQGVTTCGGPLKLVRQREETSGVPAPLPPKLVIERDSNCYCRSARSRPGTSGERFDIYTVPLGIRRRDFVVNRCGLCGSYFPN
jgi:hypothetical protein